MLNALMAGKDLTADDTRVFLDGIARGEITPAQIGAIITALRMKGETPAEIAGLLHAMRSHMTKLEAPGAIDVLE